MENCIKMLFSSISGYFKLKKIIHNNNNIIFMGASGIGDQCLAAAYLKDYIVTNTKKVIIICSKKSSFVFKEYGFSEVKDFSTDQIMNMRMAYLRNPFTAKLLKKSISSGSLVVVDPFYYVKREFCYKIPSLRVMDINKYVSYGLTEKARISYPNPQIIEHVENKYVIKNKYVIINPYSYSMTIDNLIFEQVVIRLTNLGYSVYCNICGEQKPIVGSLPLQCTVQELFFLAKGAESIISVRSGILDYIICNCKKVIAIYENDLFYHYYSLDVWKTNAEIHELQFINNEQIKDEILNLL